MNRSSESGSTFSVAIILSVLVGTLVVYGLYMLQKAVNDAYAEKILDGVWELAQQERAKMDPKESSSTSNPVYKKTDSSYSFMVVGDPIPTLIKIETGKKAISSGVCKALKNKFLNSVWLDRFTKAFVVGRLGEERTDILVYNCPHEKISTLRFYVIFPEEEELEPEPDEETEEESESMPEVVPSTFTPSSTTSNSSSYSMPTFTSSSSEKTTKGCPSGTSSSGRGGVATSGCRCIGAREVWNGSSCVKEACPEGSSRYASGAKTNVSGCYCNEKTPFWTGKSCTKECPEGKVLKDGETDVCVDCNNTSDCSSGGRCISHQCVGGEEDTDCRWGICQTCDRSRKRSNLPDGKVCEVGGLQGSCNGNGTCYPSQGRRCSSIKGCPSGEFCNYGGTFNSSKKQQGKFGQTPNVCQVVVPQEFTYKDVTYYYNTQKDLKSWCRAANNKPNCLWGYLAKPGAESWCKSLGKRLLTRAEMDDVWDVLKKKLPQTYRGYAYWIQEGAFIEDKNGRKGFISGHPDGYGGKGGVVCK